jgi:hypothetical protein
MTTWPPVLPDLKADMGIEDGRDDAALTTQLNAAVAFVQRARSGTNVGNVNFDTSLVNVNTADLTALQTLTGVDATLAQTVIDNRPYRTLRQLAWVVNGPCWPWWWSTLDGHPSVYDGLKDEITLARDPDDDLVLGTLRLAGRWYTRRRAPDDLIAAAELGTARLPGLDPDITRLLRIGRHVPAAVG